MFSIIQRRYELSDEQWEQIKNLFPKAKTGRPAKDNRFMFNAILWIARSGDTWRDLAERFGSWKTVYSRFCKWHDERVLNSIFIYLNEDADYENLSIDSTIVKAHQHSADAKKGAKNSEVNQHIGENMSGNSTKIHTVVDGLGNPVIFYLIAGQVQDSKAAIDVLSERVVTY